MTKAYFALMLALCVPSLAFAQGWPAVNSAVPAGRTTTNALGFVATNVALKAAKGTDFPNGVTRQGFTTAGDGGAATYYWSAANCVTADNGAQVQPSVTGCWIADLSGTMPTPLIWGAKGDGVSDDSAAIQNALTARAGATLWQGKYTYYIGSVITLPAGTSFVGAIGKVGQFVNSNTTLTPWGNYPSLRLRGTTDATAIIKMNSSSTLDGFLIYRAGMTFPVTDNGTSFIGRAVEAFGDNIGLRNSLIMGFDMGFVSHGMSRGTIEGMSFDNTNNIEMGESTDTWQISHIHAWPFSTNWSGGTGPQSHRLGTNFRIGNSNDATMISHYLEFGWWRGFVFANQNNYPTAAVTCIDCDADTYPKAGNIGFLITGNGVNTVMLVEPRSYTYDRGISRDDTGGPDSTVTVIGATIAGSPTAGIFLDGTTGTTLLHDSIIGYNTSAITVNNPASVLDLDGNVFTGNGSFYAITALGQTDNIRIGNMNRFGAVPPASPTVVAHAVTVSGTTLALPFEGTSFYVSDGGSADTLTGGWAGRQVTLFFGGVTTLINDTSGLTSKMRLKNGANFTSTAGSTITLGHLGNSSWIEIARQ